MYLLWPEEENDHNTQYSQNGHGTYLLREVHKLNESKHSSQCQHLEVVHSE